MEDSDDVLCTVRLSLREPVVIDFQSDGRSGRTPAGSGFACIFANYNMSFRCIVRHAKYISDWVIPSLSVSQGDCSLSELDRWFLLVSLEK